jgi:hypothetical protein
VSHSRYPPLGALIRGQPRAGSIHKGGLPVTKTCPASGRLPDSLRARRGRELLFSLVSAGCSISISFLLFRTHSVRITRESGQQPGLCQR